MKPLLILKLGSTTPGLRSHGDMEDWIEARLRCCRGRSAWSTRTWNRSRIHSGTPA